MGQYKKRQLTLNRWLREREGEASLVRRAEQAAARGAPEPPGVGKTFERVAGPRAPRRLYHWWEEPDGAVRKIRADYLHERIRRAMAELGVRNPYQLAKKLRIPETRVHIIRDWFRQPHAVSAKTGVLKRILGYLRIPFEELEERNVFLDRKFPIDLFSKPVVRLYTHVLNEGYLYVGKRPTETNIRYVNQDPTLIRTFIDYVRRIGGEARILEPKKPGFDVRTDTVTARIIHAAGLPYGRKTLTNPPLHPVVMKDKELAKEHLHITFLEEGYATFSYGRGRLQLIIGLGRSRDITDLLPSRSLKQLLQHKGEKVQPSQFLSTDLIRTIILPAAPTALVQEKAIISSLIKSRFSYPLQAEIRISYLHVSQEGRVTANYRLAMRSEEAIRLFEEIVLSRPVGAWKEHRFREMLRVYEEYKGRVLSPEEKEEARLRTPPSRIPEDWIISKAKQLLGDIAPWTRDEKKLRVITRWYERP